MPYRLAVILLVLATAGCGGGQQVSLHAADAPPRALSAWGVVSADGRTLEIGPDVLPYDLKTPLFSDYAQKLRTVWMPAGASARMDADGEIEFPVGTILTKTFYYQEAGPPGPVPRVLRTDRPGALDAGRSLTLAGRLLVETRLLVRYADGWRAWPYVWNENQDEAELAIAGDVRRLALVDDRHETALTYLVPDTNQCGGCHRPDHTAGRLEPLGPQAWQLDRDYTYADGSASQLERWRRLGILTGSGGMRVAGASWWSPGEASLESRARAYLDANCAHCHNARGPADTSALNLDLEAPVDRHLGICKTPVAVGRGSGNRPFDIYPGRPDESILLFRMEHSDPAIAMPELGRSVVHSEGVALVRRWIAAMNGEC